MKTVLLLTLVFPFTGTVFNAVFGLRSPRRLVEWVACASVLGSLATSIMAMAIFGGIPYTGTFFHWIVSGDFTASMDVYYNPESAVMALIVTFVSSVIHIYSVYFMRDDEDYVRYFCYLNLFVFSMLVVTLSDNLIFFFLGWEGVGFCSYALIGFWYSDLGKATAGRKAFQVTRLADVGFGVAIGFFFVIFNNLSISSINANASLLTHGAATLLGLLLLAAAIGKSAQLPLVVWLPDAMAGPTPVSALIHAATMVTAGVYLLMRFFPIVALSQITLQAITFIGTFTAFYGACSALAQYDIKRVLAYSTISQIGYMIVGVGAGDVVGGLFHLMTHAFYKALLFMAAGCVIQALHEDHNIFRMGRDVRRRLPAVAWLFLAGTVSLSALPLTAGYFSKDHILLATFAHTEAFYKVLWAIGSLTAFLTALYAFRLFFLVFTGDPAEERDYEIKPIPRPMVWVLWPLAFLSLFAGLVNFPFIWGGEEWLAHYLASVPGAGVAIDTTHTAEWAIAFWDMFLAVAGFGAAFFFYGPKNVLRLRSPVALGKAMHDLLISGFYLDALYERAIVKPYRALARTLWLRVDEGGVDYVVVGFGRMVSLFSLGIRLWTTGRISMYLRMVFLGLAAIVCLLLLTFFYG